MDKHSSRWPPCSTPFDAQVVEFAETHHLILVAARDIEPDEELLYDYGDRTAATIAENPWLVSS